MTHKVHSKKKNFFSTLKNSLYLVNIIYIRIQPMYDDRSNDVSNDVLSLCIMSAYYMIVCYISVYII